MLRGRPALVIVFLCFVCLLPLNSKPASRLCSRDIVRRVKRLKEDAPTSKLSGSRLKTPTDRDFQNCPSFTLKCFADEILKWETSAGRDFILTKKLGKLAALFNQTESECRQCKLLEEQNAEGFLDNLLSTLQMMNTMYCSSLHNAPPKDV